MDANRKTHSYDRQTLTYFWQACVAHRRQALLALLFPVGAILSTVGVPLVIGRAIAGLTQSTEAAMRYVPYLIVIGILSTIANRIGAKALFTLQAKAMGHLQEQAFQGLMRRSMGFHNNNVGGKLVSDAIDYPSAFSLLMDSIFTNLIPFVLILITGTTIVFIESWQLGLVIAAMSLYALGSTAWTTYTRADVRKRRQALSKTVTGHVADAIVNVPTVKTFAHEERELNHHRDLNRQLTNVRIEDWRTGSSMANTRQAVLTVMQIGFVVLLIKAVGNDPSLLDVGIFAFSFTTTLSVRLMQLHPLMRQLEDGFLNASPMTEIISQQSEIQDIPNAKRLKASKGAIDLKNVEFQYADSGLVNQVFDKLNLAIKPGEKIGLVGPSGGGKSTLTRLLLRFEDIDGGTISIDKQNIAKVTQESLRQAISYVPQEPLLFHRTVADNIRYGKPDASLEEVQAAAKLAYADEFIQELSEGYDTVVGERGVKLSGGQRQRVAIARAILKDAPLLILDEATSALDSESEVYIQQALWQLMENRTTIVIAHRLSTIQKMDRILVLENGRITEQGSHAQLLKRKGTYATLWNHQSGGFMED
jgi:ATP-binding cassette subfamily B protein